MMVHHQKESFNIILNLKLRKLLHMICSLMNVQQLIQFLIIKDQNHMNMII